MNHDELVKRAFSWLKNNKRCSIVASELVTSGMETPDVIGWNGWVSMLVEAKISVSDFRADRRKIFRTLAGRGMGVHRYYIVPSDLVDVILPLMPDGWGLLSCGVRRKLVVERLSAVFQPNAHNEILYLSSVIRRIAAREEPL